MKKVQITTIAEEFGIAPSTVSRALNDKPGVSEALRERILERAQKLGYQTPRSIHAANRTKSNIVALITSDMKNPFYIDFIGALHKELSKYGYTVTVFDTNYDYEEELRDEE